MVNILDSMHIASFGMKAQSDRLKVISQNIANSGSTAAEAGGEPYRRKTITFRNVMDRKSGIDRVKVHKIGRDDSAFSKVYDPGHPAADAEGYVLQTNVKPIVEMVDMREAQRGYEANLKVVEVSKNMLMSTLALLR